MTSARLGDIAEFQSGFGFPTEHQGHATGDLPFAKVSDISRSIEHGGAFIHTANNYVSRATASALRAKPFARGTIVFAKIGEAIRGNRRAITSREMLFDNNVMGITVSDTAADVAYVFHFLKTIDFYPLSNSTAVPSIRRSALEQIPIYLPPLDEQRRIAAILDKADALRMKRKRAITLLDSLPASIFYSQFGDPVRSDARSIPLVECAEIVMGQSPPGSSYNDEHDGVPLLNGPTEFGELSPTARQWTTDPTKLCQRGDILFCVRGATAGRINFADRIYCLGRGVAAIRPNERYSAEFFLTLLPMYYSYIQAKGVGSTFINISSAELGALPLPIAPASVLESFKGRIAGVASERRLLEQTKSRIDHLFASLQHRAFSGQL